MSLIAFWSRRSKNLETVDIVNLLEIPFSYLLLASVLRPISLLLLRIDVGVKTAASNHILEVFGLTELLIPPMTPAIAIGISDRLSLQFSAYI